MKVLTILLLVVVGWEGAIVSGKIAWQSPFLQDHPLTGKIIELKTGHTLNSENLINRLQSYPVVLLGEKHDNPDHHTIESKILTALRGPQTTVVFEMLDDRHSPLTPQLSPTISLDQLKAQLQWSEKSWSWEVYGPLFLQVVQQGSTLKAGNIDLSKMMTIYRQGLDSLTPTDRFASITRVEQALQTPLLDLVYEAHCRKMAKDKLQPMVNIQLAKDASMAYALDSAKTPKRIMITGGAHARKDIGIPRHLRQPEKSVTLLMIEVAEEKQSLQDYPFLTEKQTDFVWFTAKFTNEDYCKRLE